MIDDVGAGRFLVTEGPSVCAIRSNSNQSHFASVWASLSLANGLDQVDTGLVSISRLCVDLTFAEQIAKRHDSPSTFLFSEDAIIHGMAGPSVEFKIIGGASQIWEAPFEAGYGFETRFMG